MLKKRQRKIRPLCMLRIKRCKMKQLRLGMALQTSLVIAGTVALKRMMWTGSRQYRTTSNRLLHLRGETITTKTRTLKMRHLRKRNKKVRSPQW